jgi:hypothetical protein
MDFRLFLGSVSCLSRTGWSEVVATVTTAANPASVSTRLLTLASRRKSMPRVRNRFSGSRAWPHLKLLLQQKRTSLKLSEAEQPCRLVLGALTCGGFHIAQKLAPVSHEHYAPLSLLNELVRAAAVVSPHASYSNSTRTKQPRNSPEPEHSRS